MLGQYANIDRHPCLRKNQIEVPGRSCKVSAGYRRRGRGRMSNHFTLKPDAMNQNRRGNSSEDFRITPPNVMLDETSSFMKKECLLFYYPDCEGLAKRIAAVSGGNVELAEISWKYVMIKCLFHLD